MPFILIGEREKDLKVMVGRFVEVRRRRDLKINADKSMGILLGGEEGSTCAVLIDGTRLDHVT